MKTVLAQPADRAHDRAVRWRQLVELLARGGEAADRALFDQAIAAVREGMADVDEQVRMAAARAIASLPAPLALICAFAGDRLSVAAPVLAAARLTTSEWLQVANRATPECRRFIDSLRGEPAPAEDPRPPPRPAATVEGESAIPSISEVVARIERLRNSREPPEARVLAPAPAQPAEPPRLFRWEADESGEIAWVEGVPRGAVIGRSIARAGEVGEIDSRVERAFSLRMPFRDAKLELAEGSVVGGSWRISGMPAFDPASGRFAGYRGIAERACPEAGDRPMFPVRDPDTVRELAHEIKTPLNAIIGFAEIISGQYLGPADRPYRERAQEIVAQAQLLLTAIDDLDFAARLHSQRSTPDSTKLAKVIERIALELEDEAGVSFGMSGSPVTPLEAALAERLVSRFCKAVIATSDQPLTFFVGEEDDQCVVSVRSPAAASQEEPTLGLRLVLGLARIAGGDLKMTDNWLKLLLPGA